MLAMLDTILTLLTFFSSGLALLMAAVQIVATKRHVQNVLSCIILFCLGVMQLQLYLIYMAGEQQVPCFYFLHLTVLFAGGPASYLPLDVYYLSGNKAKLRHLLHFAPAIAALILEIVIQMLPGPLQGAAIRDMIVRDYSNGLNAFSAIRLIGLLHAIGYLSAYLIFFFSKRHLKYFPAQGRISLNSVFSILIALLLLLVSQMTGDEILSRLAIIPFGLVSIYWYFVSYTNPEFFFLFQLGMGMKRYGRSRIDGINSDTVEKRLKELMEEDKAFCDEDITLKDIAEELSITAHQLSEFLNTRLQMSFKTLINTYRVEEAKKLLISEPERSVLSIGLAVGFNSRSNFNIVFSKYTGTTPSEFRARQP